MSLCIQATVKTSETHSHTVMVTAIRINNDINGNPRYHAQVWAIHPDRNNEGNIWAPIVKGYRKTKDDQYILNSVYNLKEDLYRFLESFENTVCHKEVK